MNNPQSQAIVRRFFSALRWLISEHYLRGIQSFTNRYGINRRNFITLEKDPSRDMFQPSWLSILVSDFHISPLWLLTGEGDMLSSTPPASLRAQSHRNRTRQKETPKMQENTK